MITYRNIQSFSQTKRKKKIPIQRRPIAQSFSGWTNSFNYLEPQLERLTSSEQTYVREQSIGSLGLTWLGASQKQLNFVKKVYDINLARLSGRTFVNDVPAADLSTVEGSYQLRTNAAQSAISMLQAVRAAVTAASKNVTVGLNSAYRSASHQFGLWNDYVTNQYYPDTKTHRQGLADGEHGDAAARYLAQYTRGRIATPGYSNHNNGLALDLRNTENGTTLLNRTNRTATAAWRKTWLWNWLTTNGATYHFYQNTAIDEPWHWEYRAPAASKSLSLFGDLDSIPNLVWPANAGKSPNILTSEFLKLINQGNGTLVLHSIGALYDNPIKEYIDKLEAHVNKESGGIDVISETLLSIATLNARAIVNELEPKLKAASRQSLDTIPKEVRYMAARTGLLLAWIDKAISAKTASNLENYQQAYEDLLLNHQMQTDSISVIFGFLPYNLGFGIGKAIELIQDVDLSDKSLSVVQTGMKLKKYYRDLQRGIFNEIVDNEILGPDKLRLGTEFSDVKTAFADAVIGAWDREMQRLSG